MNQKLVLILCMTLFPMCSHAQILTVSTSTLQFDTTLTSQTDTFFLGITNNSGTPVSIDSTLFFEAAFESTFNQFTIAPGGNVLLPVIFHPRHNIDYNSEMVLVANTGEGNIAIDLLGTGKYSGTYYNSTQGLSEEPLKLALKSLISGHTSLGYNTARDKMFMNIDNQKVNGQGTSQNTLDCIYIGKTIVGYSSRTDAFNNYSVNTEHTFPQGKFNSQEPMKSDLFHLYPSDVAANSERGSKSFGVVSNPTWLQGGSKSSSSKFEPRDQQKGPASRSMLYFLIRYQNYGSFVSSSDQNILRQWSLDFLPTQVEKDRCDAIQSFQHNRNPFIDHPEFVERIHSFISSSSAPSVHSIQLTSDTIKFFPGQIGDTLHFHYVMVNDGNKVVKLSNYQLDGNDFSIIQNPVSIAPGESADVIIQYSMTDTFSKVDTLRFQTDVPGLSNIDVPLLIDGGLGTGINNNPEKMTVSLWPNPSSGKFFIQTSMTGSANIKLMDETGRILQTYVFNNILNANIDCSHLAHGIYFLQIEIADRKLMKKVLIY